MTSSGDVWLATQIPFLTMFSLQTQRMQGLGLDSEKASPYSEVKFIVYRQIKKIYHLYIKLKMYIYLSQSVRDTKN